LLTEPIAIAAAAAQAAPLYHLVDLGESWPPRSTTAARSPASSNFLPRCGTTAHGTTRTASSSASPTAPIIWFNGVITALDGVLDNPPDSTLFEAFSINDAGQILVRGLDHSDVTMHTYLLNPL